jgi:hypothetical protein
MVQMLERSELHGLFQGLDRVKVLGIPHFNQLVLM